MVDALAGELIRGVFVEALQGGAVASVRLIGRWTPKRLLEEQRRVQASACPEAVAFVADYLRCDLQHPEQASRFVLPGSFLEEPGAFVVRPDQMAYFCRRAELMAEVGLVRRVFTSSDEALAWAARQAVLHRR